MKDRIDTKNMDDRPSGKVIVVGGGIGGIQCALDLAETGFFVYLLDKSPTLGGTMAALDKTFPTNDCSTCIFSPKLVQVAANPNIEIITLSRLLDLKGEPGRFTARIQKNPRYINMEKCIACGQCAQKCPKKVPDPFNGKLGFRKAAFLTFPQAVPLKYALDAEHCLYLTRKRCGLCKDICPTGAIEFDQKPETLTLDAGAVILSTGLELALTPQEGEFGYGRYRNVVTSLQYERMLSATGPFAGHLQRPSNNKPPKTVAWIQCVLSRDAARNRPFCSSVCCMYAAKQAVLTRSHLPDTDTTIYFMDIRAHGKGFDNFIDRAHHQHGVTFRRSMISQVYLNPENESLIIETFDHQQNRKIEEEYDLVVLSSGFKPAHDSSDLVQRLGIVANPFGFITADFDEPVSTSRPGVFVCGGMEAPKDIPETVIQAGAAAAEASALIETARHAETVSLKIVAEKPVEDQPRIGVFVCHCGSNIAGVIRIPELMEQVQKMDQVAFATDFMFTCSVETQQTLVDLIQEHRLNRVVVAACSPKTHEPLFRDTLQKAGLNPYLFEMVNIRNQCSWVHGSEPDKATLKAIQLIRGGVCRALRLEILEDFTHPVVHETLVIGGGISGMAAALTLADQGFSVHLVEKDDRLGGFARNLFETLEGDSPQKLVRHMEEKVCRQPKISVHLGSRLVTHKGHVGAFEGTVENREGSHGISYGAVIVATGGQAYEPREHLYSSDERILSQVELTRRIKQDPNWAKSIQRLVMIQCVGSRNPDFAFCSRVCCSAAVKNSILFKELNPDVQVIILYRDLRTFGFKELYYAKARKMGVLFFRFIPEQEPRVHKDADHKLVVDFYNQSTYENLRVEPDLVILSTGIRPHVESEQVARLLKLPRTQEGFFMEAHVKLQPIEFASPGIYLAGLAHSPRFIPESLAMAKGAAQQAVKILCRETMTTPATVAQVNPEICAACLVCVRFCPFEAPFINADGVSEIQPAKCRGCGICVSGCPRRAITLKHATEDQINAEIDGILESVF
ncbi:MAG TPA: FAD-dependent oxidoreductase [Desulfobacterales bacterium]|nr:FAD-dependent oxidoreductase [Desulfobacterales bacterium]